MSRQTQACVGRTVTLSLMASRGSGGMRWGKEACGEASPGDGHGSSGRDSPGGRGWGRG